MGAGVSVSFVKISDLGAAIAQLGEEVEKRKPLEKLPASHLRDLEARLRALTNASAKLAEQAEAAEKEAAVTPAAPAGRPPRNEADVTTEADTLMSKLEELHAMNSDAASDDWSNEEQEKLEKEVLSLINPDSVKKATRLGKSSTEPLVKASPLWIAVYLKCRHEREAPGRIATALLEAYPEAAKDRRVEAAGFKGIKGGHTPLHIAMDGSGKLDWPLVKAVFEAWPEAKDIELQGSHNHKPPFGMARELDATFSDLLHARERALKKEREAAKQAEKDRIAAWRAAKTAESAKAKVAKSPGKK